MAVRTNQYEAMFLFGPSGAAEPQATLDLVRTTVEARGGQILVLKKWDERKLCYEILKQKRGTYVLCYFKGPSTAPAQIERDVRLSDAFVRVLILRAEHMNEQEMAAVEPQPIAPPREERMDFGFGGFGGGGGGGDYRPRRRRDDEGGAPAPAGSAAPAAPESAKE